MDIALFVAKNHFNDFTVKGNTASFSIKNGYSWTKQDHDLEKHPMYKHHRTRIVRDDHPLLLNIAKMFMDITTDDVYTYHDKEYTIHRCDDNYYLPVTFLIKNDITEVTIKDGVVTFQC